MGFFMNSELLFEEISIFSHGVHLGYRKALTDIILKGDHPRIISAKFG
jgi:metal-responsive CopG/Arc/MetJ family transcriptional regulator